MNPDANASQAASPAPKPGLRAKVWWAVLALLCMLILGHGGAPLPRDVPAGGAEGFAYMLGWTLAPTMVLWAIFAAIFMRRPHRLMIGLSAFAAIYFSVFVATQVAAYQRARDTTRFMASVANLSANVAEAGSHGTPSSGSGHAPAFTTPASQKVGGAMGALQDIMVQETNQSQALMQEYVRKIKAMGWSRIFDVERIEADTDLAQSQRLVRRAAELVREYRSRTEQNVDSHRSQAETVAKGIDIDPDQRAAFLAGVDDGTAEAKKYLNAFWGYQQDMVAQTGKVFDTLKLSKGWRITGGHIIYTDPATHAAVASALAAMKSDIARERQLQATYRANQLARSQRLRASGQ